MHIDEYLLDDDDLYASNIYHTDYTSLFHSNDEYFDSSDDSDSFLDEAMNDYHSQQDCHNQSFGKASDSEISKLQSKVDEAKHNVDVKKQDVHERQMQYNYNPDATTARRLNQAKNELSIAQRELENAKSKLNHAR